MGAKVLMFYISLLALSNQTCFSISYLKFYSLGGINRSYNLEWTYVHKLVKPQSPIRPNYVNALGTVPRHMFSTGHPLNALPWLFNQSQKI